jgi:hypothetical protein
MAMVCLRSKGGAGKSWRILAHWHENRLNTATAAKLGVTFRS